MTFGIATRNMAHMSSIKFRYIFRCGLKVDSRKVQIWAFLETLNLLAIMQNNFCLKDHVNSEIHVTDTDYSLDIKSVL